MHFTAPTLSALIALTLTVFATAATLASASSSSSSSSHKSLHRGSMARRARQGKLASNMTKRQSGSGRGSWYDPSTGAGHCGRTFQKSDPIVAVNSAQFKLSDCFKWISVTANGETHQAQITDSCPTCPYGALDFSPGFFQQFAPLSQGLFQMTWSLGGASDDQQDSSSSSQKQQQQPKTTAQRQKTTYSQPSPTSTRSQSSSSSQTPTSTSSSTVASSSSSTSSASSTSESSSSASSTVSSTTTPTAAANNLQVLSQAVNGFLAMAQGQQQQQQQ